MSDTEPTIQPVEVSVLIVSYNTRALTAKAIETLYATTKGISFETILWDNASEDGSADYIREHFPQVRVVASKENLGFSAGNNAAAKLAVGEWILLLNPDTEVHENAVANFLKFAKENPEAGLYAGKTVYADGSLNLLSCLFDATPWSTFCRTFFLTAIVGRFPPFDMEVRPWWKRDRPRPVDIIVGCWLLMSARIWRELGGFNEKYWMYGEDVDLSLRARALGYQPLFTPDSVIMHIVGASSSVHARKLIYRARGRITVMHDHWGPIARQWGIAMDVLWSFNRLVIFGFIRAVTFGRVTAGWNRWKAVWDARRQWLSPYGATQTQHL